MDLIYWPVRSSSRRGKDGVKGVDRYFSQKRHQFIRIVENLVQHPSNNISIILEKGVIVTNTGIGQ